MLDGVRKAACPLHNDQRWKRLRSEGDQFRDGEVNLVEEFWLKLEGDSDVDNSNRASRNGHVHDDGHSAQADCAADKTTGTSRSAKHSDRVATANAAAVRDDDPTQRKRKRKRERKRNQTQLPSTG